MYSNTFCHPLQIKNELIKRARYEFQCVATVPLGLPQPLHQCTRDCRLYECKTIKDEPCFVCAFSQQVHVCGTYCECREILPGQEGVVCTLTGHVLKHEQLCQHHFTRSKDDDSKIMGTNYQRCLDKKAGKRGHAAVVRNQKTTDRIKKQIQKAFTAVLFSSTRTEILKTHKERYLNECKRILREPPQLKTEGGLTGIDIVKAYVTCFETAEKFGSFLNPPAPMPDNAVLCRIVNQIYNYAMKFKKIKFTGRAVSTFTACLISKLSSGYTIKGVTVIKKSEYFSGYAPNDVVYSRIQGFTCRSMSLMMRQIQAHIVCDNGFPNREFMFAINF
mgnify:CR=1 FL=1